MFQKKSPDYIILNRCKSFSINRKKKYKNNITNDNKKQEVKSITNIQSPIKKPKLIESKSQTNFFRKTIKISFNRYHKYIKSIDNLNNNINKRPISLYNKRFNNNREEISKYYSSMSRNKLFNNNFNSNSSLKERTIFSSNNNSRQKLNLLNIGDINSPINKKTKIFNGFDNNFFLNGIDNCNNKKNGISSNDKLKNSKFFNKTKYINGIKNKIIKRNKSPSLSTYNISLKSNKDDLLYNAINEIIMKQIINYNISKITKNQESKNILQNNQINEKFQIKKAQFLDLLPIVLNHIRHKKTIDDLYKEYNKYLSNLSESSINNNLDKNHKMKNPIIRYLFLEKIINNLKHLVKFINIRSKEEIEQNVIKIIGDEYSKIKEDKAYINNNKDFLTYGYEYIPKYIDDHYKYSFLMDKGFQTSKFSNKKSIFFINEKKIDDNNTFSNEVISPSRKIFLKNSITNKRRIDFDNIKFEEKKRKNESIKNELNDIFSNIPSKKDNKNMKTKKIEKKKEFFKTNELKNIENFQKNSLVKRSVSVVKKQSKKKFLKIDLNKLKLREIIKPENNKKLDSTDRMVNPPSLEKLNQQNEKVEKIDKKILINKEEHHQKCNNKKIKVLNNALTNAILAKKTNEDKNLQHNKEDKKEENKESSDEEPENENEAPKLTKENYENLKKTAKFTRRYKKALKDKKKQEKIYKHILENNEIALKEIKKAEKQKRKKKVSVFNELMNQHRKSIVSLDEKNKELNKADNYSSVSSSEIMSELERMKDEIDNEANLNEDDIESNNEENEGKSVLGSVSEITNELEEFNEVKEIVKPKTIKEAFDEEKRKMSYRRRGGVIIPTPEVFKKIIRLKELSDLNDKMKKVYADIYREKKRDEHKKKRKKHYIYSFAGVNLDNIKDVEIRKKVHLERIKEDIKYKISQGKCHLSEMDHFLIFERAMSHINLSRLQGDPKRIREYVHTLEKYFQLFYYELLNKERQKRDEDRINKFLYSLHEEVGVTVPYVKYMKGKKCRSNDYNKEINLSELNSSNNK